MPHGERSSAPVHVDGRFQSSVPVDTIDRVAPMVAGRGRRTRELSDRHVPDVGVVGVDDRQLLARGRLDQFTDSVMSRPSSGVSASPNGAASAMT